MTHDVRLWAVVMDGVCESLAPLKIDVEVRSPSAARDFANTVFS